MAADKLYVVTGGAGFIGSNIAAALVERGERVVVADWLEVGDKWKNLAPIAVHDVIRPEDLSGWLVGHVAEVAGIVHMGAISSTTERDGDRLVGLNVRPSIDLWTWCARHQVPFVYASSAATYGDGVEGFDDDGSPEGLARLKPMNGYGWSKHMVDRRIALDVTQGQPTPPVWAGLKFFNVYGPREAHKGDMRSVALKLYETLSAGGRATLFRSHRPDYADGGQLRDFVYVADCVAVVLWILAQSRFSGLYNLGTGQARSFLDLANSVFKAMGQAPEITYVDMPEAIQGRYQYFTEAHMDRLRQAGYRAPFTTVEDGVADYVAWLRGHS
ncbi:MAG TPA: ADP-glyceromanno-heptose 6-epimerase [Caulobacteraceae bacterium]|jgi:ADP-L-glycero-D-manno-heptose 6-epimerase